MGESDHERCHAVERVELRVPRLAGDGDLRGRDEVSRGLRQKLSGSLDCSMVKVFRRRGGKIKTLCSQVVVNFRGAKSLQEVE